MLTHSSFSKKIAHHIPFPWWLVACGRYLKAENTRDFFLVSKAVLQIAVLISSIAGHTITMAQFLYNHAKMCRH